MSGSVTSFIEVSADVRHQLVAGQSIQYEYLLLGFSAEKILSQVQTREIWFCSESAVVSAPIEY